MGNSYIHVSPTPADILWYYIGCITSLVLYPPPYNIATHYILLSLLSSFLDLPHRGQAARIATSTVDSCNQFTAAALMKCDSNHYNIYFNKVTFCVTTSSRLEA